MQKQDKHIEAILNSLDGIEQAEANPFLFEKIQHRMRAVNVINYNYNYKKTVWLTAALSFMLVINGFFLVKNVNNTNSSESGNYKNGIETFSSDYFVSDTYDY